MTAHAQCPKCRTPGAYVGFVKVECANTRCEDYVPPVVTEHTPHDYIPVDMAEWAKRIKWV